jgi:O-antigen ligase
MTRRSPLVAKWLALATVAWGALAFGAVYPWGYWTLVPLAGVAGAALAISAKASRVPLGWVIAGVGLFAVAVGLQLVPLSTSTLTRLSPETVTTLQQVDLPFALGLKTSHALSLRPDLTVAGLAIFLAAAALTLGIARYCTAFGVRWLATGLTGLGVAMAFVGIIQKATFNGKIYGFWEPIAKNFTPFGPFVNRDHFAGWMMMTLPVALGLLLSRIDRGMEGVKPEWRERFLWFGSRDASELIMSGLAAAVMALSLVLTLSRAGIGAFVIAVFVIGLVVVITAGGRARKAMGVVYLVGMFAVVVGWAGVDLLTQRFDQDDVSHYGDRKGIWADARRVAASFPLTGVGFGSYGTAMIVYQQHGKTAHTEQAHDDYLQLAAEGGVLLVVPAILLAAAIARQIWRRLRERGGSQTSWWVRIGALTGLLAIGLQEIVDFSLQMPGNAILCAVLIGIALHRAPAAKSRDLVNG